jgi:hypothetical protein
MAIATQQTVFPLLTTGLSRSYAEWLRTAGISFKSYEPGTSLARFFSQNRDRILIFDSRNPTSRCEAETALQFGCEVLDISPLASGFDAEAGHRREITAADWILHLSRLLRLSGRLWLRVHDLPAGYDAVVFDKGLPDPLKYRMILEGTSVLPTEKSTYIPRPHFGQIHDFSDVDFDLGTGESVRGCWWKSRVDLSKHTRSSSDVSIWSPTVEQFDAWRTFRNRLQLEAVLTENAIRIETQNLNASLEVPLLELWRENHVARFPIEQSPLVLRRSCMVYEQAGGRHPAGLFLSKGIGLHLATSRREASRKQPLNS